MNPFVYQGPVRPDQLIDRADELDRLQRAAADRVNVRLAAPRRYGKSSLLGAHLAAMRAVGHRVVLVDLFRVATVADVAYRVMAAYGELPGGAGPLADLSRRLGVTLGPAGITVQVGPRGARETLGVEQARAILLEVLALPEQLYAGDRTLTVVAFDEFQDLLTADDKLDGLFRSVLQHHDRSAAYIYAGSRPSLLREMFAAHERPFFGQARPLALPPLPGPETHAELAARFASAGVEPGDALADVVAVGEGHPQRTMLLAHLLYNVLADGGERVDAAAAALDLALEETSDVHQAIWMSLARAERAVVVALADGLAPTGPIAAAQHATPRTTLKSTLDRLAAEQQVLTEAGRLLDPLFAEWLRRR